MNNRELEAAWNYHNRTKHSYHSVRNSSHFLDWENQPLPFKIYSNLDPISLPHDLNSSGVSALKAIADPGPRKETKTKIDKQLLAEILHFAAGITKRRTYPGGEILFRAAACTGALYHIDLYAVCGELEDLAAGIYQFSPQDFSLRRLREGDYRPNLVAASGDDPNVVGAPVTLVCASTYWRNSWKYQARAYRHCYWDNGTILGNLLAVAAARQVRSSVILGFVDSEVGDLLSLDPQREAPLSLVPLGSGSSDLPPPSLAVKPLHQETSPLSKKEIDYPAIREMHLASSLERGEEVTLWRQHAKAASKAKTGATPGGTVLPLQTLPDQDLPSDTIEQIILRRGSTRQFAREPISLAELSTMLKQATGPIPGDFTDGPRLNELYLIVNAVEGLMPGAYVFHRDTLALELLKEGNFRHEAGYLGLGQAIPADASVDVFFLADLNVILERFGNRGYRAAQLEASIAGGKLYLSAYAQHLGASGLTFFDDDVTEFFSPHAAGKSVMFLVALGRSVKRARK